MLGERLRRFRVARGKIRTTFRIRSTPSFNIVPEPSNCPP